jgi:hypothetical protein
MMLISIKLHLLIGKKLFIMVKHVFCDLSYATIMSNMIKEMTKNLFINYQ